MAVWGGDLGFDSASLDQRERHNARDEVQSAWKRVRTAGSYHFAADVTQRSIPIPTVTIVGRRSRQDTLHLEVQTNLRNQAMQLTLWSQGGRVLHTSDGLEIQVEGDRAIARQADGTWADVGDFAGAFALAGDFLAFLASAQDISRIGKETRAGVTFTRYAFRADGPGSAVYAHDQLQRHLDERADSSLNGGVRAGHKPDWRNGQRIKALSEDPSNYILASDGGGTTTRLAGKALPHNGQRSKQNDHVISRNARRKEQRSWKKRR
jgi:hypothetical protein